MSEHADETARQRFIRELESNFSVIASAGSGKTSAITQRIVQIAKSRHAIDWLPKLVVVTYTNRAADEMQQRTRTEILESGLPLGVLAAFNRAFFGTIHSFCLKLLGNYGHHLGLPAKLETITATGDDDLWNEFVQQQTTVGYSLSEENRAALLRHIQVRQLMELGRRNEFDFSTTPPEGRCPDTSFISVYRASARSSKINIPKLKKELERWERRWRETKEFVSWPECTSKAKEFGQLWRDAFKPLRDWVNACAICVAAEVQRNYREFRLERGALTYPDQVALAVNLMRHSEAARRIREKNYRVILDEAQDTEPGQFSVLLEIARPPTATGDWNHQQHDPPRAGHFCMVGDFQQSIYRDRAELEHYRRLHETLTRTKAAEEVKFSVTFRLDQAQLDFVNQIFPEILTNAAGQVGFVELNPRPNILPGQVVRLDFEGEVDSSLSDERRGEIEARQLAAWIRKTGLKKLCANSWRQVAVLSPRKAWLRAIRDALRDVGLSAQIQSESDRRGESPAYAWFTALLTIMSNPHSGYEIVGVLRDVFGISDDNLARFAQGDGARFQIAAETADGGTVPETLNLLARTYCAILGQPLFTAVRQVVRTTMLRERLRTLPAEEFGDTSGELDALLTLAATAEASGITLADFVENLRANFDATREVRPSSEDAVQLLTAHKAKGLEWQAVIIPFLSRWVSSGPVRYPRVIKGLGDEATKIAFARSDISPEMELKVKDSSRQEMERLLYVALTRARHSLTIAFDPQLFAKANGEIEKDSQLKWLRADVGETNRSSFELLPTRAQEFQKPSRRVETTPPVDDETFFPLALSAKVIETARESQFIRKLNPSMLEPPQEVSTATGADKWKETEPELRPITPPNRAMQYGVWWHDFMQRLGWPEDNSWDEMFAARREEAPDEKRFAREWKLLREHLAGEDDFRRFVSVADLVAHSELPFLWRMEDTKCLEGSIDLALLDRSARSWFIVDWKTNQISRSRTDELKQHYRLQISAYWKALAETTRMPVQAALFSTATGRLLRYENRELEEAWSQLNAMPSRERAVQLDLL